MADQPGYTRIPNDIIEAMPYLGNAELRVLLAIARKTVGFQKSGDRISVSQIEGLTGLTSRNAQKAIGALLEKGHISREQVGKQSYSYSLQTISPRDTVSDHIPNDPISPRDTDPYPLGTRINPKPYPLGTTQKKDLKEKRKGSERATRATPPPKQASMSSFSESVKLYKDLTGLKQIAPVLADKIADVVIDLQHWRTVLTDWLGAGYSAKNTDGMLDWYLHPDKMTTRKNGSGNNGRRIRQSAGPIERANWTFEGAEDGAVPAATRNGATVPGLRRSD